MYPKRHRRQSADAIAIGITKIQRRTPPSPPHIPCGGVLCSPSHPKWRQWPRAALGVRSAARRYAHQPPASHKYWSPNPFPHPRSPKQALPSAISMYAASPINRGGDTAASRLPLVQPGFLSCHREAALGSCAPGSTAPLHTPAGAGSPPRVDAVCDGLHATSEQLAPEDTKKLTTPRQWQRPHLGPKQLGPERCPLFLLA